MSRRHTRNPSQPADPGEVAPPRKEGTRVTAVIAIIAVVGALVLLARAGLSTPPRQDSTPVPGTLADPSATYDPVKAGEPLPRGFRQLLRRDAILPIYDPTFIRDDQNESWDDDTLVIGVAIDGEAKAYPVSFLNRREMVIDSIAGIPILVTW